MPQEIAIETRGEKMLISSNSRNKLPTEYLSVSKNARIRDFALTKRRGYKTVIDQPLVVGENQGITYNNGNYLAIGAQDLLLLDIDAGTASSIGTIGKTGIHNFINYGKYTIILTGESDPRVYDGTSLFQVGSEFAPAYLTGGTVANTGNAIQNFVSISDGSFAITIDGTGYNVTGCDFTSMSSQGSHREIAAIVQTRLRVATGSTETVIYDYNLHRYVITSADKTNNSSITQTSATGGGTHIGGASQLDTDGGAVSECTYVTIPEMNPYIGTSFTGFTFIVGSTTDYNNTLFISNPITTENPENCYDWGGDNSEQIEFDSDILGLASTINQLFIFTEKRIEYIGTESLSTIGGSASLISTPIGDGGQLASSRSAIAVGNKVFYLTNNKTINALNYLGGTDQPEIGILTDKIQFKITNYLDNLDDDQSNSFGYYDDNTKTVHRHLKTEGALYNDTVLIYDIENETWTTDTKKLFNDVVVNNQYIYAGSSVSNNIIQDNIGLNDDGVPVEFEIEDTDISLGTILEKLFQGWQTSGGINRLTNLNFTTYIDNNASSTVVILGDDYFEDGETGAALGAIGGAAIGGTAIGGLEGEQENEIIQFDKILDHSNLYRRGKRIRRKIIENSLGADFYLDLYTIYADVTGNKELSDTF